MSGWLTNGVPLITTSLTGNEQASFDTENTAGAQPETVAISTNQLAAYVASTTTTSAGLNLNKLFSTANALTAVGTNRATALALTADTNNVTTAAASTGVSLPAPVAGARITIFNGGANPFQVYALGSDTIDGVAGATGVPLTNAKRATFYCVAVAAGVGTWISAQLGVVSA